MPSGCMGAHTSVTAVQVPRGGGGADHFGGQESSPGHFAAAAPAPVVGHRPLLPQNDPAGVFPS